MLLEIYGRILIFNVGMSINMEILLERGEFIKTCFQAAVYVDQDGTKFLRIQYFIN